MQKCLAEAPKPPSLLQDLFFRAQPSLAGPRGPGFHRAKRQEESTKVPWVLPPLGAGRVCPNYSKEEGVVG